MANHEMDPNKFRETMHSLNYGSVMEAAARDYKKEMQNSENTQHIKHRALDANDLMDDPELEKLYAERMAQLQQEAEKRQELKRKGHGEMQEVEEGDFLEVVTQTPKVVVHFWHRDFERCKIMDKHLSMLAPKYFDTRFVKVSAQDCPFFTVKLQVQMLPCVIFFLDGVASDRVVGFEELGGTDHWETAVLERRMLKANVVKPKEKTEEDSDDEEHEQWRNSIRQSAVYGEEDESSEFSD